MPFHPPGHKQGKGLHPRLLQAFPAEAARLDLSITNLNGRRAREEAERLAAEAYGADRTYFLVNGSSEGVHALLLTVCNPGDTLIMPRNCHKSVIAACILGGLRPAYLRPVYDPERHITHNVEPSEVKRLLDSHPAAKAVLLSSPTYYGVGCDIQAIARMVHGHGLPLLVDEAWGAHFPFHPELPRPALTQGADAAITSTHKLLSGFTQASMLHLRQERINPSYAHSLRSLLESTSPSCLLLASLDVARMQMATGGREPLTRAIELAEAAREEINAYPPLSCFGMEVEGGPGAASVDPTRLTVTVRNAGYTGWEAARLLRERFHIEVDLADACNILADITLADTPDDVRRLVQAVVTLVQPAELTARRRASSQGTPSSLPGIPPMRLTPRDAYFAPEERLPLRRAVGRIAGEMVTPYPPGIPMLCPGEEITEEVIDYLEEGLAAGMVVSGTEDPTLGTVKVVRD